MSNNYKSLKLKWEKVVADQERLKKAAGKSPHLWGQVAGTAQVLGKLVRTSVDEGVYCDFMSHIDGYNENFDR